MHKLSTRPHKPVRSPIGGGGTGALLPALSGHVGPISVLFR